MGKQSTFSTNTASREPGTVSISEQAEVTLGRLSMVHAALRRFNELFADEVIPNLGEVARVANDSEQTIPSQPTQDPNFRANLQREIAGLASQESPLYDATKAATDPEAISADNNPQMAEAARQLTASALKSDTGV